MTRAFLVLSLLLAACVPVTTPTPSASPSASGVLACVPSDQDQYVYNPTRLVVLAPCIVVTGTVAVIRIEADGDRHILVQVDPEFEHLLTPANQGQELGDLVVEPVCVGQVTQADAVATCAADKHPLSVLPSVGQHVQLEGRYVTDSAHGGWAELHPLYGWASAVSAKEDN